jgi:CRISPR system Cascade subunit CasB
MREVGWSQFPSGGAGEERPRLSEARFRRLLRAEVNDDLPDQLIRLVRLAKGRVAVSSLARDFMHWNDKTRQRWAFEYFNAGQSAPSHDIPAESDE